MRRDPTYRPLKELAKELDSLVPYAPSNEQKLADFLEYLSEHGNVGEAARHAHISRRTIFRARKDPEFERLYQEAQELGTSAMEDEAILRATKGTMEPVFWKGRRVATIRKKSDLLLMFILKARRPELYRDNYSPPDTAPQYDDAVQSPREVIASRIARLTARTRD